jgi:hypothetical protein
MKFTHHQRLLRRKEAARYLSEMYGVPTAPQTLAKLATIGGGPLYRKFGRFPLYHSDDLDKWISQKLGAKRRSTSEALSETGANCAISGAPKCFTA